MNRYQNIHKREAFPSHVHEMAYLPHQNGGYVIAKERGESKDSNLEDVVVAGRHYGTSESEVRQSNYAINLLMGWDDDFHASGKYDTLARWLNGSGYNIPIVPQLYATTNELPEAAAWTISREGVLGINPDIENVIYDVMNNSGLETEEEAIELLLTHEYVHNGQLAKILDSGDKYLVESDAEKILAQYFHDMAKATKGDDRAKYIRLSKAASSRYVQIMMKGYMDQLKELEEGNELEHLVAAYEHGYMTKEEFDEAVNEMEEENGEVEESDNEDDSEGEE